MSRSSLPPVALLVSLLAAAAAPAAAEAPASAPDPAVLLRAIAASHLEPSRAVSLGRTRLNVGPAVLRLEEGVLVPAVADGLSPIELVYLGRGRIEMAAPDAIESGQLELFTGVPRLNEGFTEAVFVLGPDAAVTALLRNPATRLDAAASQRAESLWSEWRRKRERKIFDVDRAILLDALGDRLAAGYFGAWFRGGDRSFLYFVSADEQEQVTLGRFVPLDATEKEKRSIAKELRRQQSKGRARGLEVEDLGQWDTWLSTALRDAAGHAVAGVPSFEPTKYTLDVRLSEPGFRLEGRARVDLERVVRGSRAVGLTLPRDFEVKRVSDGMGSDLFFHRGEGGLTVILPPSAVEASAVTVVVDYAGNPIEKDWNLSALLDTDSWYPRAGIVDHATYEATFHWPKSFDLVASGRHVAAGQDADGSHWERRTLDVPTQGFSFEIGHFDLATATVGHVQVTFAFGPGAFGSRRDQQEVVHTVTDALAYYEGVFGPYPLDTLTVSTVPRGFSQGLLSFVTISDWLGNLGVWNLYFGVEDRRLVIAHELAHQWWGNVVGWNSYRDQWISEAMAEYSASLYGKNRLQGELSGVASTEGWQEQLTTTLVNGRPIESLGPVVLGYRLSSSLSSDAYRLVVYKKGAVVLNMLASVLGEETFNTALGVVVKASAGRNISTAELFSMLGRATATDLDGFAQQFVYGTGLPEVTYSYHWAKEGATWVVKGQARQMTPYYFRYRVVKTDRGTFDVARQAVPRLDVQRSALVVPTEIAVLDRSQPKGKGRNGANKTVVGRLFLKGESTDFSVPLDFEPQEFWLDRHASVFGLFFDETRYPKRTAYYRAEDAVAAGRLGEAEALFREALAATDTPPESEHGETVYWQDIQAGRRLIDARIQSSQAFLFMDMGRDDDAEAAIGRARRIVADDLLLDRMEARLEVRRGRYDKAYRLLRRGDRHDVLDAQDYALLAIACRETGHTEEAEKAVAKARENGVDVTLLMAARAPAGGT
ncbi:MAG TPA: M1 family aminopeptidase [Thermoanaerobaculia bacterium]|jgi:hypothetical protein|nr:M1 family aminopeptidase [Thermoanaerobaculia bacterium]